MYHLCRKNNYQIFKIIAVPVMGKNSELFIATDIDIYIGINYFFVLYDRRQGMYFAKDSNVKQNFI